MKKNIVSTIILLLVLLNTLSGCSLIPKEEEGPVKVGLLVSSSPDDSYSEGYYGYYALKALENKYGVEIAYNDNVTSENNAAFLLNSYGKKGYDLVIGIGSIYQKPMSDVASSYSETRFVCIGGGETFGNMVSYTLPLEDIGYIAGAMSAGFNKNEYNGIAYVQHEGAQSLLEGFRKGVAAVNGNTPVKEFLVKKDETFAALTARLKGGSIGLAGIMFYSPNLEKNLMDGEYIFSSVGGPADDVKVPRVLIDYDVVLDRAYNDYAAGKNFEGVQEIGLDADIVKVIGLDLVTDVAKARIEGKLPKGI